MNIYHRLSILDGLELLEAREHKKDFPSHTHDTFNITLILKETFNTRLADKVLRAPVGTLLITNPDEIHATPCEDRTGNSFVTFYLSPEILTTLNNRREVFFEDRVIYNEYLIQNLSYLSSRLNSIDSDFERRLMKVCKVLVSKYTDKSVFKYKTTELFQSFLNETELDQFSLTKTAQKFGLNKYKFLRLFKQETGLTPNNYVLLKRIEKSKALLLMGNPIVDVALESGFFDSSHFYRHFKRFTGVTPSEYQSG